jgi:hypothetical protein
MNDVQKETPAESAKRVYGTLLTTLTGIGSSWAAIGLKMGKMALTTSAETLGKTAHALDVLATELEKKTAAPAPTGDAAPAGEAPTTSN